MNCGNAPFLELVSLAKDCGFPPVVAEAVVQRIEPVVLYACELLPLKRDIFPKLNALQGFWAKTILNAQSVLDFRAALAVAMCGWRFRRASKAIGRAILYLTKVSLLPAHPTAIMVRISKGVYDTWTQAVLSLMSQFPVPIPTIEESGLLDGIERCDTVLLWTPKSVKCVLRKYQFAFILPAVGEE